MKKKFIIIDGNSFAYRAFYALPPLTTKDGLEIQAVYGFFNMFLKILKDKYPNFISITFDHPKPTFRHRLYEKYKIQREPMPESLQTQMKIIKEITKKSNIGTFEIEGYEADDIIAALVFYLKQNKDLEILIASSDKDMIQLLSENVHIIKFTKEGYVEFTPEKVIKEMELKPEAIIDVLSLMGDTSDNIPGVKGIGEKTAIKLIKEYGTLDNLLNNLKKIKPERIKNLIEKSIDDVKLSRELAILKENPEIIKNINFEIEICSLQNIDKSMMEREFIKYNFKSLVSSKDTINKEIEVKKSVNFIDDINLIKNYLLKAKNLTLFFNGEKENLPEIFCLNIDGEFYYFFEKKDLGLILFKDKIIITNSAKEFYKIFKNINNCEIYDIMLLAYLLNPDKTYRDISIIFNDFLNETFLSFEDVTGKGIKKIDIKFAEKKLIEKFVYLQLENAEKLKDMLIKKLEKYNLFKIYTDIELPLTKILSNMEKNGIKIDRELLLKLTENVNQEIILTENKIYEISGEKFNINSPKQLSEILFNKLNLPVQKKIKTGYSTDNEVLQNLLPYHEIINEILKHRTLIKYKTAFLDSIKNFMDNDSKIYPSYNQNVTATGRLSSSNPNIQNIPVKDDKVREIRKIFIPFSENEIILKSDYSQIELRILAHICKDPVLINIYNNNGDIHTMVAASIFGQKPEEITKNQRRIAKTINFGIIYGMSGFGLAKELGISRGEAKDFIEKFFKTFPDVKKYQENIIKFARDNGYVETIWGRKRFIQNILSKNKTIRELAERSAINAPIQGSAADIIKIAMINIYNEFIKNNLKTKIIFQVHDELVFSVFRNEKDIVEKIVKDKMEKVVKLNVPLLVDLGFGRNWYECG